MHMSISCSFSVHFQDLGDDLLQMVYVPATFLLRDCSLKCLNPLHQLILVLGFTVVRMKCLTHATSFRYDCSQGFLVGSGTGELCYPQETCVSLWTRGMKCYPAAADHLVSAHGEKARGVSGEPPGTQSCWWNSSGGRCLLLLSWRSLPTPWFSVDTLVMPSGLGTSPTFL